MYSEELDRYIKEHGELRGKELAFVTDAKEHQQINHVKYNPYENKIEIWTSDRYYWKV